MNDDMFWLKCYAFFWLALTGYMAYAVANHRRRVKQINDLTENSHIYEAMLAALSPHVLVGILAAVNLFVIVIDTYGFMLAYSYVPMKMWHTLAFVIILAGYVLETMNGFVHLKKMRRIFNCNAPFRVLARYSRFTLNAANPTRYVSAYGRCLVAVNLFLYANKI